MTFKVSTTGADFLIADLGVLLPHPTVDRDLELEFSADELAGSGDLTSAISGGSLTLKVSSEDYVETVIDGYYYNPYLSLENRLRISDLPDKFISADELAASDKDIYVFPGVFPIPVSSTTSFTKTVVCNSASFESWQVGAGDVVVVVGGAAAGQYTIDSVDSQNIFVTVEAIPSSIGAGVLSIYHPTGAGTVGLDPTGLLNVTSSNVQGAIEELDAAISAGGLTAGAHEILDTLVHNISEDNYEEIIYSSSKVLSMTHYTDITKATKVREFLYTYSGSKVATETAIQYNVSGVEVQRLVSTFTYSGGNVASIDHVETP